MADVYFEALPDLPGLPPEGPLQRHTEESFLASSTPEPGDSAAHDARGPQRPHWRPLEDSIEPGPNSPGILDARSGLAVPPAGAMRGGWLRAHAVLEEGGVAVQLLGGAELPAELLAGRCRINIEL